MDFYWKIYVTILITKDVRWNYCFERVEQVLTFNKYLNVEQSMWMFGTMDELEKNNVTVTHDPSNNAISSRKCTPCTSQQSNHVIAKTANKSNLKFTNDQEYSIPLITRQILRIYQRTRI